MAIPDPDPEMTREQFFASLDDDERLALVRELLGLVPPGSREKILGELATDPTITPKETTIQLEAFPEGLKISFGRPIAWMNLPKAHALRLAMMMLEACGCKIEQPQNPTAKPPITI